MLQKNIGTWHGISKPIMLIYNYVYGGEYKCGTSQWKQMLVLG